MTTEQLQKLTVPEYEEDICRRIKENWNRVAKPLDGLGELESMICRIGAAQGTTGVSLSPRGIIIMCADNGVVEEGVSQSGQEVTLAVAENMGARRSSVCRMAQKADMQVIPVDIGINSRKTVDGVISRKVRMGTRNFLKEPAMTREELLQAIETGMDMVRSCQEQNMKILATGEMGIGNTTTSTALGAALLSSGHELQVGRGAGLDDRGLQRKTRVILEGLEKYGYMAGQDAAGTAPENAARPEQTLQAMERLGGLDIAGLCGVFLGGARYRIPVIIDGVISAVAALCARRILPGCGHYMLASHIGEEPMMGAILEELHLMPVIRAGLKLGEGTGAVMLLPLLDMALEVYKNSNSFRDIGVAQYERYPS